MTSDDASAEATDGPTQTFADLGLDGPILKSLKSVGYETGNDW